MDKKIDELGLTFSNNRNGYTAGKEQDKFLEIIFEDMADADKNAASTSEAADDANDYSVIADAKRQVAQQNREALIKKAEMLRDDANSAKNRYFDATMRAQDATRAANDASVALADAIAKGDADAIAAAELAEAQAQADADAAAEAQAQAEAGDPLEALAGPREGEEGPQAQPQAQPRAGVRPHRRGRGRRRHGHAARAEFSDERIGCAGRHAGQARRGALDPRSDARGFGPRQGDC